MNVEATSAPSVTGRNFIREWTPDTDRAFVADAWLNTLRGASTEAGTSDWSAFRAHHNRRIDHILDGPGTRVRVAGPDDLVIRGFLVHNPSRRLVHMLFVRKSHRRQGIGRLLLSGVQLEGATFTEWSTFVERWILRKFSKAVGRDKYRAPIFESSLVYNPYFEEGSAE